MPNPTSGQRPTLGRLTPVVPVRVRQVNGAAVLHAHAWLVLGLIGMVLFGLRAFGAGDALDTSRTRFVEVRAAGHLLAEKAALVDDPDIWARPSAAGLVREAATGFAEAGAGAHRRRSFSADFADPGEACACSTRSPMCWSSSASAIRKGRPALWSRISGRDLLISSLPPRPTAGGDSAGSSTWAMAVIAGGLIGLDAPIALHQVAQVHQRHPR